MHTAYSCAIILFDKDSSKFTPSLLIAYHMKTTPSLLSRLTLALAALALPFSSPSLIAATQTWTGASSNVFGTAGNWNGSVPTATDIALWDSSSSANLSGTFSSPQSVLGLQ